MARLIMVAGGARSGKSRYAEQRCRAWPRVGYVATLAQGDDEMAARIAHHRARRPAHWSTVEAPTDLGGALHRLEGVSAILVDCLTGWLSNCLLAERDTAPAADRRAPTLVALDRILAEARHHPAREILFVTNEVGAGLVPPSPLGRAFRDLQGWANQRLAAAADEVYLLRFGLADRLK